MSTETPKDLFERFNAARAAGDMKLANQLAAEMRDLGELRRFAHLSDEELREKTDAVLKLVEAGSDKAVGPLYNSEGNSDGGESMIAANQGIHANAVIPLELLTQLEAETEHRRKA